MIESAYEMMKSLIACLLSNGRLYSSRVDMISNIQDRSFHEYGIENLVENANTGIVVIDLRFIEESRGRHASHSEQLIIFFDKLIKKYRKNTLFIFVDKLEQSSFAERFISTVTEHIDVIELKEGKGTPEEGKKYLERIIDNSDLAEYRTNSIELFVFDKKSYTPSDIYKLYRKWNTKFLCNHVYTSYCKCKPIITNEKHQKGRSYTQLMELVGLTEVKKIVDQIIATSVVDKERKVRCANVNKKTLHMLFTGNPGSAKTTVARLLAEILYEHKVIDTGVFVECGRADLIDRYVGWAAKEVRTKFRQANGGILFIDEAYSLVDDSNSFADEAINTIVQEMENNRESVIVIFAGYPNKMKDFLDKNEGLRSRIAFHIDFPDYKEEELLDILNLMLREQGYSITEIAKEKARKILRTACSIPEFGNGRFVRNMIEHAIMKQSLRLYKEGPVDEILESKLYTLEATDFDLATILPHKEIRQPLGFCSNW